MGEMAEDVVEGRACMKCGEFFLLDSGDLFEAGHPCFCHLCWKELPKKQRDEGAPYFDEEFGQVFTG